MFSLLGCFSCGWFTVIRPYGTQQLMLPVTHWQGWERREETGKRTRERKGRKKDKMRGSSKKCLVLTVKHFLIAMAVADNDLDLADGPIQMEYNA